MAIDWRKNDIVGEEKKQSKKNHPEDRHKILEYLSKHTHESSFFKRGMSMICFRCLLITITAM